MREILSEVRKLSGYDILMALLGFIATLGPGFLTLYHFRPALVKELDLGKLLLFSASLSTPVLLAETFLMVILAPSGKKPSKSGALIAASMGAAIAMYTALLVTYLRHLGFRWYLGIVAVIVLLIAVIDSYAPERGSATSHGEGG